MQEREWMAHLDACKAEGISLKAYANRHGLAVDSLYYQRRKMTLRGLASAPVKPSKASSVRQAVCLAYIQSQSVRLSVSQSVSQSVRQAVSQSVSQSVSQPVSQSVSQSVIQSA